MSITKNIKCTDENTSKSIKQILNIKDSHISFSKDAISKESIHGRMANVFTGLLTGEAPRCEYSAILTKTVGFSCFPIKRYQPIYTCTNNVFAAPDAVILFLPKPIM